MVAGFVAFACVIASITEGLASATRHYTPPSHLDLASKTACTYNLYAQILSAHGARISPTGGVDSITDCYEMLAKGQVDAVAYDHPALRSAIKSDTSLAHHSVGTSFNHFDFSPVIPYNSEIMPYVTWSLSKFVNEHSQLNEIVAHRFPHQARHSLESSGTAQMIGVIVVWTCWSLFFILQLLSSNFAWVVKIRAKLPQGYLYQFLFGTEHEREVFRRQTAFSSREVQSACGEAKVMPCDESVNEPSQENAEPCKHKTDLADDHNGSQSQAHDKYKVGIFTQ